MSRLPSYNTMHKRLTKLHGPARHHACAWCGRTAASWSYSHSDPDEIFDADERRLWSADPAHYLPMCTRHHRQLDRTFREGGYDRCLLPGRIDSLRKAAWSAITDEQRAHEEQVRATAVRLWRIHHNR